MKKQDPGSVARQSLENYYRLPAELKAAGDNAEAFTALEKAIELANREEEGIDDDLIGVDEDGDGFDAYDEKLTGHSDTDPDDKPTQEEVDAALAALEDK